MCSSCERLAFDVRCPRARPAGAVTGSACVALRAVRAHGLHRLIGRYGKREAELDDLLRRGVFVNPYRVVRSTVWATVSMPGPRSAICISPASV